MIYKCEKCARYSKNDICEYCNKIGIKLQPYEVEKMKLQQEAMEALEWIESTLENIKGDTFFEANKNDCLSVIAKAIKKLV